jgi:hypothetical protein
MIGELSGPTPGRDTGQRVAALSWPRLTTALDERGFAEAGSLLTATECAGLVALYHRPELFRSKVVMARHGYGRGEYQYFAEPLPALVEELRQRVYPHLVPLANGWAERLGSEERFPATLDELRARCRAAGQTRPTPLMLRYGPEDYNCLHQDLYGRVFFPIQLLVLLSAGFTGGELVLTEQRPRMQSRAEVLTPRQGEAVLFAVNDRPVPGKRGYHRVKMRHGVSRLRTGERFTLGVIFHDAE